MSRAEKGELAVTLAGLAAWLVMVLFRGFSMEWLSLPLAAAAVAALTGGKFFLPGFLLLLTSAASSSGAASCAVAGLYCLVCSERTRGRLLGWLALAAWAWAAPSPGAVPLLAAGALVSLFPGLQLRLAVSGVLSVLLMCFSTLPVRPDPGPRASRFLMDREHGWWKVPPVTLAGAGAVLAPPFPSGGTLELQVLCGGVRDSLPVVAVQYGSETMLLPMGEHHLTLELSGADSLFILPLREHRPFTHPVAHVYAEAFQ